MFSSLFYLCMRVIVFHNVFAVLFNVRPVYIHIYIIEMLEAELCVVPSLSQLCC
jgi:hypothetical protein